MNEEVPNEEVPKEWKDDSSYLKLTGGLKGWELFSSSSDEVGIDEGVKDVVSDLNDGGYETFASCEGHPSKGEKHGFIAVKGVISDADSLHEVKEIFKRNGFYKIKAVLHEGADYTHFQFPPIGN